MNKKNVIILAYDFSMGGITKSLIELVKLLEQNKYNISILVEKNDGEFKQMFPSNIDIQTYKISTSKITIYRKIVNRILLIYKIIVNRNKFQTAICFTSHSKPLALLAPMISKKSIIFMHTDLTKVYENNLTGLSEYVKSRRIKRYSKIVFPSIESMTHFKKHFKVLQEKLVVANNILNPELVKALANEYKVDSLESLKILNISRHDESVKQIKVLINLAERMKHENIDFRLLLIGDGPSTKMYQQMVNEKQLNDCVVFLGSKMNPYPYLQDSDFLVNISKYEGFPVVFLEALILKIPIITTIKVSDYYINSSHFAQVIDGDITENLYKQIMCNVECKKKYEIDMRKYYDESCRIIMKIVNSKFD